MSASNGNIIFDPFVEIHGIDISEFVAEADIKMGAADVQTTTSKSGGGPYGTRRKQGLKDESITLTLLDNAAGYVRELFHSKYRDGDVFEVRVAESGSAISNSNPAYTADCIITDFTPFAGAIGTRNEIKVTLPVDGVIDLDYT